MFLLIGSNAIQMIALRNHTTNFNRNADAKISLLKEVIERVQRGEDVDVEGLLGTGDKAKEREWEEVIREIEEEDRLWQAKGKKRKDSELSSEQAERSADTAPIPIDEIVQESASADAVPALDTSSNVATKSKTAYQGFY
ncbi:MAG: hypothetical protein FRX48_00284 [Lasallia pustulata]|uniref:Uncharacterized protein n=1 Tax=Lasallia pustulata TaxID=136370 RepID=A0A5M8Q0G9_9LECA|nr:MAG: hypothetical protein FRX48_00284 [Lasallia pustulata]